MARLSKEARLDSVGLKAEPPFCLLRILFLVAQTSVCDPRWRIISKGEVGGFAGLSGFAV